MLDREDCMFSTTVCIPAFPSQKSEPRHHLQQQDPSKSLRFYGHLYGVLLSHHAVERTEG